MSRYTFDASAPRVDGSGIDGAAGAPSSPTTVCADWAYRAYHDTHQLVELAEREIAAVVPDPNPARRPPGVTDAYLAEAFEYDAERDVLICPQGKALRPRKLNPNKTAMTYQAKTGDCQECPFESKLIHRLCR